MKYRQRGYKDSEKSAERDRRNQDFREEREKARKVRHGMIRESAAVLRCADCGHTASQGMEITQESTCEKCQAALHNCRNCRHFDTQARWQCRATIPARIESKTAANDCSHYEARAELDSTGRRAEKPSDNPRDAFDALFKK